MTKGTAAPTVSSQLKSLPCVHNWKYKDWLEEEDTKEGKAAFFITCSFTYSQNHSYCKHNLNKNAESSVKKENNLGFK